MARTLGGKGRRRKGQVGEREFFAILNNILPERLHFKRRLGQERDGGLDGGSAHFAIEVKRQERLRLKPWLDQLIGSLQKGQIPVLAFRRSNEEWRCLVEMDVVQLAAYMRYRQNLADTEQTLRHWRNEIPDPKD